MKQPGCPLEEFSISKLIGLSRLLKGIDKKNVLLKAIVFLENYIHNQANNECPYRDKSTPVPKGDYGCERDRDSG
jgi:hypothetical protein